MNKEIGFWGSKQPCYFLSNFYRHSFKTKEDDKTIVWKTSEHLYQYKKVKFLLQFPENQSFSYLLESIISVYTPTNAKKLGHTKLKHIEEWEKIKDSVMLEILRIKFKVPELRKKLIETNNALLVEYSADSYWGIGLSQDGLNMLGKLLMQVRKEIKNEKLKNFIK